MTAIPWKLKGRNVAGLLLAALAVVCLMAWAAKGALQSSAVIGIGALAPSRLIEGSILEIRGTSAAPFGLAISGANGNVWLAIDPVETVVLQGGRVTQLSNLEKGQRVKARYATEHGKEVARSIEITDPLPMPAPTDKPVPTAPEKTLAEF